jgi:hypothetical protein
MHHKRKRPKNSRSGCLLCKPWKANGIKGTGDARPMQERRSDLVWCGRSRVSTEGGEAPLQAGATRSQEA